MSSWTGLSSTGATEDQARSAEPRRNRIGIGKIVVLSLGAGLAAAVLLPFIPWPTVDANFATAMVLFGFAVGWALLAALSVRLSDQPQRWAYAPALFMGVAAVLLLFLPDAVLDALDWIWPPALLVLVAWVFRHAKRDLRSGTRTWLLNPVLAVLVLFALGGAYETIGRRDGTPRRHAGRTRRCRTVPSPPGVHRHGRPDRHPRARRRGVGGDPRFDRARGGAPYHGVRLRPSRERDGVTPPRRHPTARRSRPTSTRCSSERMCLAPTSSPATPSAACT